MTAPMDGSNRNCPVVDDLSAIPRAFYPTQAFAPLVEPGAAIARARRNHRITERPKRSGLMHISIA